MNHFADNIVGPALAALGDWSLRWGVLILLLAAVCLWWRPRRAATRHLLCRTVLLAGLMLPLLPRWGPSLMDRRAVLSPPEREEDGAGPVPRPALAPVARRESVPDAEPVRTLAGPAVEENDRFPMPADPPAELLGLARLTWLALGLAWSAGVLFLLARLAHGLLALRRLRREAAPLGGAPARLLAACAAELGVRRAVVLASHPAVRAPVTADLFRPLILAPADWADRPEAVQRAALLHELTHVARRDGLWAVLHELVRVVFFFHPLVLGLLRRLEVERELLCDEAAVGRGVAPRDYVRMLLAFAGAPRPDASLAWGRRRTVKARISHLLEKDMRHRIYPLSRSRAVLPCGVLLGLAVLVGGVRLMADAPAPKADPDTPPVANAEPDKPKEREEKKEAPRVRRELLRYGGKSFEQWRSQLETELKPELRAEGVKALLAFGANGYGAEAATVIFDVMKKSDPNDPAQKKLWVAGMELYRIGPEAVKVIKEGLASRDRRARLFATYVLEALSKYQDDEQLTEAARAAVPAFLKAVREDDVALRGTVITAIYEIDPKAPALLPAVLDAMKSKDTGLRYSAFRVLTNLKPPAAKAVPVLIRLLEDVLSGYDSDYIDQIVRMLVSYKDEAKDAVPVLVKLLRSKHKRVSDYTLVDALGQIGRHAREAVPALREILLRKDLDPLLRKHVTAALEQIEK
jgi:beta-lactamase regulating signal transducer with metallopeptidase domain/HEAT repeat protein